MRKTRQHGFLRGLVLAGMAGAGVNAMATHTSFGVGVGTASPIATESAATLPKGRWAAGIRTEYVELDEFSNEEFLDFLEADPDAHIEATDSTLNASVSGFYGLTDDLTVGFRLPYVRRFDSKEAHDHDEPVEELGDSDGLGDLVLIGQYRFLNLADTHHAAVLLGVKAPTGDTDETTKQGERFETDLQPGSGSWDGLFGLAYTYWFAPFAFDTSVLYTYVTEGEADTDLGDAFNYNFALSYRLGGGQPGVFYAPREGLAWDLILELNGEWRDTVEEAGVEDPNHGGHVLYVSPGVRLTGGANWSVAVSFGIPAVTDLNGIQAEQDYRILSNIGVSF